MTRTGEGETGEDNEESSEKSDYTRCDICSVDLVGNHFQRFVIRRHAASDALNDPFMGLVVDNTRSRCGQFKPWNAFGELSSALVAWPYSGTWDYKASLS